MEALCGGSSQETNLRFVSTEFDATAFSRKGAFKTVSGREGECTTCDCSAASHRLYNQRAIATRTQQRSTPHDSLFSGCRSPTVAVRAPRHLPHMHSACRSRCFFAAPLLVAHYSPHAATLLSSRFSAFCAPIRDDTIQSQRPPLRLRIAPV